MKILPIIGLGLFAVGCVPPEAYLQWSASPPAPVPPQGRVAVRYAPNHRPEKKGAGDLTNVGNERSGWGIPYAIRPQGEQDKPIDATMTDLVLQSLQASGIGVTQPQDPYASSHLSVEIHRLWCDGYMGYKAEVTLQVVVLDPRTGAPRTRFPVEREGSAGYCKEAYRRALTDVFTALTAVWAQPGVRAALTAPPMQQQPPPPPPGQPGTPPPPPPPPPPATM